MRTNGKWIWLRAALVVLMLCQITAFAESNTLATVNTRIDPLNLWDSTSATTCIIQIPRGETVIVIEKGDEWTRAEYEGHSGYVRTQYLLFTGVSATEKYDPMSESISEEEKTGEIVFQGIPWGSSIVDVERLLREQGATDDNYDVDKRVESLSYGPDTGLTTDEGMGCRIWDFGVPSQYKIAGYSVDSLFAYCYYDYDEDKVHRDASSSHFILLELKIDVTNADTAFTDLSAKLSSLYGTASVVEDSSGWISSGGNYDTYETWNVWRGENNTAVVLYQEKDIVRSDSSVKKNELTLSYGKTDMLPVLQGLVNADYLEKAALEQQAIDSNANDLSGL